MIKKNIRIPRIGVGTWALAGDYWGPQKHSDSLKMIHAALREQIELFDTSPDYGKGKSEQLLGQQLPHNSLQQVATKCFIKPTESVEKSIENSLKRLNRDYIDYFFIHWPSTKIDGKPMMELLEKYRTRNKIKYIGVSNFNKTQLLDIQKAGNVDIVQNAYNFFWNTDQEYFKYCKKNSIATQAYSPLAQGLLTGKFTKTFPFKSKDSRYKMVLFERRNLEIIYKYIDKLLAIAQANNLSIYELSLHWTLSQKFIDSIVVGCRNREQLETLCRIKNSSISINTIDKLNRLSQDVSYELTKEDNIFNHSY